MTRDPNRILNQWLLEFWHAANKADERSERLALALRWAHKKLPHVSLKKRKRVRKRFTQTRYQRLSQWSRDSLEGSKVCFVCWYPAECEHHIIQIKHGGDNRPQNRLPLCQKCHRDVHPWMKQFYKNIA